MAIAILLTALLWARLFVALQQAPVFPRGGIHIQSSRLLSEAQFLVGKSARQVVLPTAPEKKMLRLHFATSINFVAFH
jgi:hypothetical protein